MPRPCIASSKTKNGPDLHYWNEFAFKAYHHHQSDAIILAGIPDLKATLPHAE